MRPVRQRFTAALRRGTDIAGAALLLCLCAPLGAAVALAVLLDSGAPVLYREQRLGRDEVPFLLRKFRCLRDGAGPQRSVAPEDDPRLTRTGRFLRRWRLDEMPQLINVIGGSMSLVGPRPLPLRHAASLAPDVRARLLSVRPGLTGAGALAFLAEEQVLAGEPDPEALYLQVLLPRKVALELDYLSQWSWRGDFALALRTAGAIWSRESRRHSALQLRELIARCRRNDASRGDNKPIDELPAGAAALNNAPKNNPGESRT